MAKILIVGGSGLIGKHLQKRLEGVHELHILSRQAEKGSQDVHYWNSNSGEIDLSALEKLDVLILLQGASIGAKRWSKSRKQELFSSRIKSNQFLIKQFRKLGNYPKTVIAATAIGYYGDGNTKEFTEEDPHAENFIGTLCSQWEMTLQVYEKMGVRLVINRPGIVIAKDAYSFKRLLEPLVFGVGALPHGGESYFPWIHIEDMGSMIIEQINNHQLHGIYNAVAPDQITYKELHQSIIKVLRKRVILLPIPMLLFNIILGEMAKYLFITIKASAKKQLGTGFKFKYLDIDSALESLR